MTGFPIDKAELRTQCLARRLAVSPQEAKAAGETLARFLLPWIADNKHVIAGYRAMRGEIDPSAALAQLATRGHTLCLPVVEKPDAPLVFRQWQPGQKLEKGAHGTLVPPPASPQAVPDILLVPLVAFDSAGHRLGYGAGYYDRTIAQLRALKKSVQIIGLAYAAQEVERIPAQAHDERLDAVVTEHGITEFA